MIEAAIEEFLVAIDDATATIEAGRQGAGSATQEVYVAAHPWGFRLANVTAPVGIWHGALDRTIPVETAEYLADAIPGSRFRVHDDAGHLSLPVNYADEILSELLEVREP